MDQLLYFLLIGTWWLDLPGPHPFGFATGLGCNSRYCPSSYIGDDFCDTSCNNPGCSYDTSTKTGTNKEMLAISPCYAGCIEDCVDQLLGDGTCDSYCNTEECAWDLGDCSYCASGCEK